jgi:hypothetical protein
MFSPGIGENHPITHPVEVLGVEVLGGFQQSMPASQAFQLNNQPVNQCAQGFVAAGIYRHVE